MKKWLIVLLISLLSITVIAISGVLVYKYYLLPKYIEPVVEDISDYVNQEEVLDKLYKEAVVLHDDGIIEDEVYTRFIRAYDKFKKDDVERAKEVIEKHEAEDTSDSKKDSLSIKYGTYRVSVETIRVNDTEDNGKADVRYSDECTSTRVKAEDIVEAEKVLEEAAKTEGATPTPDVVKSAYEKLRQNMTTEEFNFFTKVMRKLDLDTLKTFLSDKKGLKNYLKANLTEEEYNRSINLGYKYIYVFIEK